MYKRQEQERATPIDPVIVCYASNPHEWEKDRIYMYPVAMSMALDNGSGKHRKGDEDLPDNKKKKKRNKGAVIYIKYGELIIGEICEFSEGFG